jgi:phage shock protein PspC (stress-responsive transcriptional regulator)
MTDERKEETAPDAEATEPQAAEPEAAPDTATAPESQQTTEPTSEEPSTAPAPEASTAPVTTAVPQQPPPRRLVRRAEGKMLAGVCSGLAAYLGLDPVLVRVGFVLATILGGGSGLLAYIVLWLVMPMAPEGEPLPPAPHTDWFDSSSVWRWTAIALIIAAVFLLSDNIWHFRPTLFWGLLLLGVGVALWSRELHVRTNGDKPKPPPATGPPPSPTTTEPIGGGSGVTTPLPPAPTAPIPSPQGRPPSALGRLVVGAAALAVGIMFLLDNLRAVHVTARQGMAVVLAVIGIGLIVGAWWGRARWLVFPGGALALVMVGVSFIPDAGVSSGNVEWAPQDLSELQTRYRHGAGNVLLDLSNIEFDSEPRTVRVRQAFGNLEIVVPDDVPVAVKAHARGGNIDYFGRERNGFDVHVDHTEPGDDEIGLLTIRTDTGFGNTEIRRIRPGEEVQSNFRFGPNRIRIGGSDEAPRL